MLLFLDTETTGLEENDRLIQLAYQGRETPNSFCNEETKPPFTQIFKNPVPISFGSMAVHHITEEVTQNYLPFENSDVANELKELSTQNFILVAHNAPFDLGMLKKEGIDFKLWIDTERVAEHILESDKHNLQYLRYSLNLKVEAVAHDAGGDVAILMRLFDYLYKKLEIDNPGMNVIDLMMTLSVRPILIKKLNFGRHKGKTFEEVAKYYPGWLEWLYNEKLNENDEAQENVHKNEKMIYTLEYYLSEESKNKIYEKRNQKRS